MARRYHGTSISYSGDTYLVELWDGSTPASPDASIELIIADFSLNYDKPENSEFKEKAPFGVMPSDVMVQFAAMLSDYTWDSSTKTNLENIALDEEQKWAIKVKKNGNFYWAGRVLADQMHFPFSDKYEFVCEIVAKDCLNLIDGYFVNPSWFTINTATRETAIVLIAEILDQTGLLGYFPSDVFADAIAITNASFPASNVGKTLAFTTYNIASFIDNFDVTLTSDKIKYIGCKDAINNILKPFGARVCLANGLYYITEPDGYQTSSFGYTTYGSTGALNTYNTTLNHRVSSGVTVRPCWEAVPDISFQKPIRGVEIQWNKQNYLLSDLSTAAYSHSFTTTDISTGGTLPGKTIKVSYRIKWTNVRSAGGPNYFKFKVYTASYYAGDYYTWNESTGAWDNRGTVPPLHIVNIESATNQYGANDFSFNQEIGEPLSGHELRTYCSLVTYKKVWNFSLFKAGLGYWSAGSENTHLFTGKIAISQAYSNTDPAEYVSQHKYENNLNSVRATNSTYLEYAINYYNATSIKDVGGLMIFNGTTYVVPGNWSVSWHSVTGDINKVLAENITGLYSNFLETINGTWHDDGDFHAVKSLYVGTKTYIFNGGTYNFKDDAWSGEWICVDTDYTLHTAGGLGERTTQKGGDTIKDKLFILEKNVADMRAIIGVLGKGVIIPDIINNGDNTPTADPGANVIWNVQMSYDYSTTDIGWRVQKKGIADWVTVPKIASESVSGDSTLTADTELKIPFEANKTYAIRGVVSYTSTANADFKFDFNGPASPTSVLIKTIDGVDTVTSVVAYGAAVTTLQSDSIQKNINFNGVIQNGTTAGDLEFRWSQGTSHSDATSVLLGSYLEYMELPEAAISGSLLLEIGDILLLETGDEILL
jgi:hypothetical protein